MERNREGRRAGSAAGSGVQSATRRPRAKDVSDDEDRMEDATESRAWERPKKERLATFHVSASSNLRNKRKRQGLPQESQASVRTVMAEDADESAEETEIAPSEDDDEPPPPPLLRKPGKSRVHAKEDEFVMDIPAVPRKARSSISSSSRFTSILRRQQESLLSDTPRQQSPVRAQTSLNGSSSPNFLQKLGRRLKPVGTKFQVMKAPKVSEPSTISDQEVEVAEALFVLARSTPSHAGVLESKFEAKLEIEARTASPPAASPSSMAIPSISGPSPTSLHNSGVTTNGYVSPHVKDATGPVAEAPKRKRPRVVAKQEEGRVPTVRLVASSAVSSSPSPSRLIHSSVGETELDPVLEKAHFVASDVLCLPSESLKGKAATDVPHSVSSQLHNSEEMKTGGLENQGAEHGEVKVPKQEIESNADMGEQQSCRPDIVKSSLNVKHEGTEDIPAENDGLAKGELPSRSLNVLLDKDGGISKLKIDLMVSPTKLFSSEEDAPGLPPTEKQSLGNDAFIKVTGYNMEAPHGSVEEPSKHNLIMDNAVKGLDADKGLLKPKERADGGKQELKQESEGQMHDHRQKEQIASQIVRGPKEGDGEKEKKSAKISSKSENGDTDNAVAASFVPSTPSTAASSSAIPVPLAGWISQMGYYGSGATPWASLPGPNLDVKTAHPAMQLPHAAILSPVPRMKRCATHVYVAHFIHRELQMSRHTLWSAALCRATPYNLNIPPVNMLDNEKLSGAYVDATRKAPTQQSGPSYGYTISQSSGPGMTGSSGTLGSGATGTISAPSHPTGGGVAIETGTGTGTGTASGNAMAAHAQYLQAMMQQNGFASFSFPFNGPPGQAPQFFNTPFFPPHLMPPLPHLQPLAQQPANVLPVQKQQQGMGTLPHSITSQLVGPPLQQQQQLQLHLAPQSPSHSQQQPHNHMGTSAYHFGAHSEKESTVGGENLSTAESRVCAMQRSMFVQGPSNLPNLNISPLMLATSSPALPSHDQDVSLVATSGGKQTGKSQQQVQFQGQDPASFSSSMQQHQFISQNTGSGPGLQMKVLDQPLSQGYSAVAMSGANRGPVGPGPLGLVSVASMMATQGHGALPGSCENTKVYVQQQQGYGGHNQQYQRTIPKAASVSEDAYTVKGRDYSEDKKVSMKQVGAPPHLSRVDMEASSPSFQGSPTSGSGASTARLTSNVGRTLNPATPPGARSSRSAPSVGAGQVPLLQNQPPKQAVGRTKAVSGTNVAPTTTAHTVSAYAERVLPGNLSKFSGTVLPFSGQMAPSSQGSKPSHAGMVKVSQRMPPGPAQQQVPSSAMAKSQGQQARSNQPGVPSTPPRMLPSVSVPVLSSGTLSMSSSHSSSVPKVAVNKSPNGKGTASLTKSGPPAKKPPVSGPAISSAIVSPGQNISVKAPTQQKSQAVQHVPQFPQQHSSTPAQQQRVGTKNQVYPQLQPQQGQYKQSFQQHSAQRPQLFLQQHQQQYLQQSPSQQQQAVPQHLQLPVAHHYQQNHQNSVSQHGQAQQHLHHDPQHSHLQQQIQPSSSPPTSAAINGLSLSSPNLTLGTAISGNICSSASSDGADQFKGSGPRANPSKAAYSSGNSLPSGMPEMNTAVSGQVSSPHSGSSHYLPLAPVKSVEHKPSSDGINREETNSIRHLPSSSPSQAAIASNSMSS